MRSTCPGARSGRSAMTTRPLVVSRTRVFSGSLAMMFSSTSFRGSRSENPEPINKLNGYHPVVGSGLLYGALLRVRRELHLDDLVRARDLAVPRRIALLDLVDDVH